MHVFDFEPAEYRDAFAHQGYVHIPGGINPDFLDYVRRYIAGSFEDARIASRAIPGKKEQCLFEFASGHDYEAELFDAVSSLTGLERATMTLSERHINGYDAHAAPEPAPHKDRYASQISVGLSIQIPPDSQLVLYPDSHLDINPFNTAKELYDSLPAHEKPEVVMGSAHEVVIDDQPGDVVAFHGNRIWHLRRNSARSYNLYLKFNDFDCDPLAEDSRTLPRREATLAALEHEIDDLYAAVSRRLDVVTTVCTRHGWASVAERAKLWGSDEVSLTQFESAVMRSLDGRRDVAAVVRAWGGGRGHDVAGAIRSLASAGVIDLLPSPLGAPPRMPRRVGAARVPA